jgi:hypothetical protein
MRGCRVLANRAWVEGAAAPPRHIIRIRAIGRASSSMVNNDFPGGANAQHYSGVKESGYALANEKNQPPLRG